MPIKMRITKEMVRQAAYHEAAHALAIFLAGHSGDIHSIDMRPTSSGLARVWERPHYRAMLLLSIGGMDEAQRRPLRELEVLNNLIGYATDSIRNDPSIDHWQAWNEMGDEHDWYQAEPSNDLARAYEMAATMEHTERRRGRLMYRVWTWARELLREPRVWHAVETLARRLELAKTMRGNRAVEIMAEAWGDYRGHPPITALGPKWRRRFKPPAQPKQATAA